MSEEDELVPHTAIPVEATDGRARHADNWVGAVRSAAHDLEELLADPEQLTRLTSQLTEFAVSSGAGMVTGSSALGNQLAGLIVARSTVPLALWAQNGAHGTVLVVEGVLVSGAQMSQTARRARLAGAARVVGAAVVAEPNGLAACRAEMGDEVSALRSLELVWGTRPLRVSRDSDRTEAGHGGVSVQASKEPARLRFHGRLRHTAKFADLPARVSLDSRPSPRCWSCRRSCSSPGCCWAGPGWSGGDGVDGAFR